jgi:hypothetical protein
MIAYSHQREQNGIGASCVTKLCSLGGSCGNAHHNRELSRRGQDFVCHTIADTEALLNLQRLLNKLAQMGKNN